MAESEGNATVTAGGGSDGVKFAGKYETPAAFETGILEARKAVGLPELPANQKLIGTDGLYADMKAAELGYKDLTAMLRLKGKGGETPPPKPGEPLQIDTVAGADGDDLDVNAVLTKAGLQLDDLVESWTASKKLTDEQYAALKALNPGYTKAVVNTAIAGMMASRALGERLAADARTRATELAGGADNLQGLMDWARDNLTDAEKTRFNTKLADVGEYEDAILALVERRRRAAGAGGSNELAGGSHTSRSTTGGFSVTSDPAEFFATLRKAQAGDGAAMAQINNTPPEVFARLASAQ